MNLFSEFHYYSSDLYQQHYILVLQNILEQYNALVEQDVLEYPAIGMEKDNSIWRKWKNDKIHGEEQEPEKED